MIMRRRPDQFTPQEFELSHEGKKEQLVSIEARQQFKLEAQAKHWAKLVAQEKKGEKKNGPRVEEAGINNRLYRYCRGNGPNAPREFAKALQQEMPHLSAEEQSKEVRKLLGGVKNLEMAVRALKKKFKEQHEGDSAKHTLAMNDYLDAANMVDLVEIIENEDGRIERVNLVQVKGKLDTTPQSLIQSRHQECLDNIGSIDEAMIPERIRAMKEAAEQFYSELSAADDEAAKEIMNRYEQLLEYILDAGLSDMEQHNESGVRDIENKKSIERIRNAFDENELEQVMESSEISMAELVEVFGQSQALEILAEDYADEMGADTEESRAALRAAEALEMLLSQRNLSPEELAANYSHVNIPENLLPFTEVYSITYREDELVEDPVRLIGGAAPKALTKK